MAIFLRISITAPLSPIQVCEDSSKSRKLSCKILSLSLWIDILTPFSTPYFVNTPPEFNSPFDSVQFSTESVTDEIWKRVLRFALAVDDEHKMAREPVSRVGILLVSKKFAVRESMSFL
jgi:hypothetical protein